MQQEQPVYHLFERFGVEIEYMIVDAASLAIKPIADRLIRAASGSFRNEVERGPIAWSNELALHLIELKTNGPASSLDGLAPLFLESIRDANALLQDEEAQLLGTAMHPFMNPHSETKLWPHGYSDIYEAFDRIFSCNRHGWSNLQSVHVNLPFANDAEFGRLHAAVRLTLPIIPALAAGSPLLENHPSGFLDTRMETYRSNSVRIPSITGEVIPEPLFSREEYRIKILEPIYRDLAPLDELGILREEWVNARGAIARFERNTIEIRAIDAQETPSADLAIAAAVVGAVKLLTEERYAPQSEQRSWQVEPLKKILLDTIKSGERAIIGDAAYLKVFGMKDGPCTAGELWKKLIADLAEHDAALIAPHQKALERIVGQGTLATRILGALGKEVSWRKIDEVYRKLGECLREGTML